jgi:hypothetical protein
MRIYRPVAALLLVAQTGCYTTRVLSTPNELVGTSSARVWVTTASGGEVIIASARVLDDTIFGFDTAGRQYALPVKDAKFVKVRELSTMKTIGVTGAFLAASLALAILLKGKGADAINPNIDCDKHPEQCAP